MKDLRRRISPRREHRRRIDPDTDETRRSSTLACAGHWMVRDACPDAICGRREATQSPPPASSPPAKRSPPPHRSQPASPSPRQVPAPAPSHPRRGLRFRIHKVRCRNPQVQPAKPELEPTQQRRQVPPPRSVQVPSPDARRRTIKLHRAIAKPRRPFDGRARLHRHALLWGEPGQRQTQRSRHHAPFVTRMTLSWLNPAKLPHTRGTRGTDLPVAECPSSCTRTPDTLPAKAPASGPSCSIDGETGSKRGQPMRRRPRARRSRPTAPKQPRPQSPLSLALQDRQSAGRGPR